MPEVTILYFAQAAELVGCRQDTLVLSDGSHTEESLISAIIALKPQLKEIETDIVLALNESYMTRDHVELNTGDEIAIIPPVSGG